MDGSAAAFVDAIDRVGDPSIWPPRAASSRFSRPSASNMAALSPNCCPAAKGFRLDVEIDFNSEVIGRQRKILDLEPAAFRREIFPRPHLRLPGRRRASGQGRLRAGRVARKFGRHRRRPHPQSRRPALLRRIRAPQDAGRCRRSRAGRRAADRRLPFLLRRPQDECRGARGAVCRPSALSYRRIMPRPIAKAPAPISAWSRRRPSCPSAAEPACGAGAGRRRRGLLKIACKKPLLL